MPTSELISVSEYLHTSYRPDCDYVDGLVLERNVGEFDHADIQGAFVSFFRTKKKQWNVQALPEWRVHVSPTRFRIPDVCVVLGREKQEPILRQPPFICIEVLSNEDRMPRVRKRLNDFLNFGVPHVWVVDSRSRKGYTCTPKA